MSLARKAKVKIARGIRSMGRVWIDSTNTASTLSHILVVSVRSLTKGLAGKASPCH